MVFIVALLAVLAFAIGDLLYRLLAGVSADYIFLWSNLSLGLCCWVWIALKGGNLWPRDRVAIVWVTALVRAIGIGCAIRAFSLQSVAGVYLIIFLSPLWSALGARFLGERIAKRQLFGVVLAIAGLVTVFGTEGLQPGVWLIWALAASILIAATNLLYRRLRGVSPMTINNSAAWLGVALALIGIAFSGGFTAVSAIDFTPVVIGGFIGIGITAVVGPLARTWAAQRMNVVAYAATGYLQIPIAIIGAWLAYGERLSPPMLAGLLFLTIGSLVSQWKPKNFSPTPASLSHS